MSLNTVTTLLSVYVVLCKLGLAYSRCAKNANLHEEALQSLGNCILLEADSYNSAWSQFTTLSYYFYRGPI